MKKIYIDLGHGENGDPGALSGNLKEHEMNIVTGTAMGERLVKHGYDVKIESGNLSITESAKAANYFGADLLYSQHYNAGGGDRGEVIYSIREGSDIFVNAIVTGLKNAGQTTVKTYPKLNKAGNADYYGILRCSRMPAVIVEPAFIDHADDRSIADTSVKQKYIGICIADAIADVYGSSFNNQYTQAISKLVKKRLINAPDYWLRLTTSTLSAKGEYMAELLAKTTGKSNVEAAIACLESAGIINSPDYWLRNCTKGKEVAGQYVQTLIINIVNEFEI